MLICKFGGGTSSIALYTDYLEIKASKIQAFDGQEQTIPLDSVVTISIVKPFLKTPYLQVITPGLVPTKKDTLKGAAANVVFILPGKMKVAKQIQEYVAQYKNMKHQQLQQQARGQVAAAGSSLDDLKKLSELKDAGVISEAEFEAKKKQILGL